MAWRRLFRRARESGEPALEEPAPDLLERVRAYHQLTKHDLHAYARGPGYLAWESQPAPFRRWEGAPLVALPQPQEQEISWEDVLGAAPREPAPFDLETLSRLLVSSLGVSAWKQAGEATWALRANPSSGNLHPTELHLVLPALAGVSTQPCVAHYAARQHGLESLQGQLAGLRLAGAVWVPRLAMLTVPHAPAWTLLALSTKLPSTARRDGVCKTFVPGMMTSLWPGARSLTAAAPVRPPRLKGWAMIR